MSTMEMESEGAQQRPRPAGQPLPKRSFLPEFADERNRELDREIRALEAELEGTQIQLDENQEHTKVLVEHLDNVRLEIKNTQGRLTARTRELETEVHLREIAARETGRLRADIARLQQERSRLAQHVVAMQTELFKGGERMDQFKLVMNWNQEELEQWTAAAHQKEEDSLALEKYRRQDEAKVKELEMQLERAAREAHQGKRDLDDAITETQAAQAELSKAAQDFRRLHAERQELLQQWEAVLEAIKKRDATILEAGQEVAERQASLATLKQELVAQAAALDAELATGAALQKTVVQKERQIKGLCDAYGSSQAAVGEAEEQLDLLANSLGRATDDVQRQTVACGHLRAELQQRAQAVEAAQAKLEVARVRVALEGQQLGNLQQKIQELEALRAEEQRRADALEKELAGLSKQQLKAGQALHEAQEQERRLVSEIAGARAQGRNLSHKIAQLEEQLVHQQEVQYNTDFQVLQMERRVKRAEGHRSHDETEALNARIRELGAALQAAAAEHGMLAEEVKRAEDDYARAHRQSQAVQKERASIVDDMARLEVESAAVGRAVKAVGKEQEEKLVEVDVWKLEVRRLRTLLNSKSGEVSGLEARKRTLEAGMRERRSEVEMQLELMKSEERLLREEVHRVTLELQGRQLSLQKLRSKHEALVLKGRGQDGEEAHSQAYYIIKAAQERQELTQRADELTAKIQQTEGECRALEATLRQLVGTNIDMNQYYRRAGVQPSVLGEQGELRQQLDRATQSLRAKLAEEAELAQVLKELRARLEAAAAQEAQLREQLEALCRQKADAQEQLQEQQERWQRAAQRAARLLKQVQAKGAAACKLPAVGVPSLDALTTDVQVALVREATKGMLEALKTVAAEHPELDLLQRVGREAGVKVLAAESSSRPGSAAGAVQSVRSVASVQGSPRIAASRPGSSLCPSPSRAAAAAGSTATASRPASCTGGAKVLVTTASSSPSKVKPAAVCTVQLQL